MGIFLVAFTYNEYIVIFFETLVAIDTFTTGYVVFLMQAQNKEYYHAFIMVFDKLHLSFCCETLVVDTDRDVAKAHGQEISINSKTGSSFGVSIFWIYRWCFRSK